MFTGIITDIGMIRAVEQRGDLRIVVDTAYDTATVAIGASMACSGACLTVVDKGPGWFAVDMSHESVACTAPDMWRAGGRLNLERAMKLGDELGGHIVTGHVDGVGEVIGVCPEGDSYRIAIRVPESISPFVAPKGSITIDGVSLTLNDVRDPPENGDDGTHLSVNIIPHTAAVTTLGGLTAGTHVNLEIDILARYLARMQARK